MLIIYLMYKVNLIKIRKLVNILRKLKNRVMLAQNPVAEIYFKFLGWCSCQDNARRPVDQQSSAGCFSCRHPLCS